MLGAVALASCCLSRSILLADYESAAYTVIEKDGAYELRQYPELLMASTTIDPDSKRGNGSFMRLFRYISGKNVEGEKVAMTTPVFMENGSEKDPRKMGFVVPRSVAQEGAPEPSSKDVEILKRPSGRYAVIQFSGRSDEKLSSEKEGLLRRWMKEKGLLAVERAEIAGYDPPWTPGPLRKNEVLIRVEESSTR